MTLDCKYIVLILSGAIFLYLFTYRLYKKMCRTGIRTIHLPLDSLEYKPDLKKFNTEKEAFLKEFNLQYGYGGKIDRIREEEYPQLKGNITAILLQVTILIHTFN